MTKDSRRFEFTYGCDDTVTVAMQEGTYQWEDIVFVAFSELCGDCLFRKSRTVIVLSKTEYNESFPILAIVPMTRILKGLDSKYHVFIDREDCNNELNTSGMCMLGRCQTINRRQIKHEMGHVYDERLQQKICNGLVFNLQFMDYVEGREEHVLV